MAVKAGQHRDRLYDRLLQASECASWSLYDRVLGVYNHHCAQPAIHKDKWLFGHRDKLLGGWSADEQGWRWAVEAMQNFTAARGNMGLGEALVHLATLTRSQSVDNFQIVYMVDWLLDGKIRAGLERLFMGALLEACNAQLDSPALVDARTQLSSWLEVPSNNHANFFRLSCLKREFVAQEALVFSEGDEAKAQKLMDSLWPLS